MRQSARQQEQLHSSPTFLVAKLSLKGPADKEEEPAELALVEAGQAPLHQPQNNWRVTPATFAHQPQCAPSTGPDRT